MPTLFLAGQKFNLLERAEAITVTDEDTDNPKLYLHDGRPNRPFKFATMTTSPRDVKVRNQILLNNHLDVWSGGLPTSWTKAGPGTVTQETVDRVVATGSAAKIAGTGGTTLLQQDIVVRAGERLRISGSLHGLAGATAGIHVRNLTVGKDLTAAGGWTTSLGGLLWATTSTTYITNTLDFQVEPYSTCQSDLVTLRIFLLALSGETTLYDEFYLIPGVDFIGVFGHNVGAVNTVAFRYSVDNFATENVLLANPTVRLPSFYHWNSAGFTYREWWKVQLTFNIPQATPAGLGELVLGQAQTLTASAAHPARVPWSTSYDRAQVRHESDAGDTYAFNRGAWRRRIIGVPYRLINDAKLTEAIDEIRSRCEDGVHPLVVVPESARPEVIHGRIDKSFEARRVLYSAASGFFHDHDLVIRESAFPTFAA